MVLLSLIFFISSFLSAALGVLTFLGLLPGRGRKTVIAFAASSFIFAVCEIICVWNPPYGFILVICGILIINIIFLLSRNENGREQNK